MASLLPGPPPSILYMAARGILPACQILFLLCSKSSNGSHLPQSKCPSPYSRLPGPAHPAPSHLSDIVPSTHPLAYLTPAYLAFLPFLEHSRHSLPQDIDTCSFLCLEELTSREPMNCFFISTRVCSEVILSERPS